VHIQFFIIFKGQQRISALKKHCPKAHFTAVKRDNGASDYCLKEDTRVEGPWEFGVKPARRNVVGDVKE
jgi:Putative viral replication protein.